MNFKGRIDKLTVKMNIMQSNLDTDMKWALISLLEKDSKLPHISTNGMKMMDILYKNVAFDDLNSGNAVKAYVSMYSPKIDENICVGVKPFPSISHLPGSNMTDESDTALSYETFRYAIANRKDNRHKIIIRCEEKSDGSCVGVANIPGIGLKAIGKAGYNCASSPYLHHRAFAEYVNLNLDKFEFLNPGDRIMGEWMLLRHAIPYQIDEIDDLFRPFAYIVEKGIYEYVSVKRIPGCPVINYTHALNDNLLFAATINELMAEWENKHDRKLMEETHPNDYKTAYFAINEIIKEKALRKLDKMHPDDNYEGYVIKVMTKLRDESMFPIRSEYKVGVPG